ncbi:MAG TPA: hypothetical protein VHY22_09375 [Chthoniobacteraceae bacterium]|nr:hypothetical protein [Chthoniobacteraceae bacterium]
MDEKKRLTIPSRWRDESLEEVFIIKSPARGCLSAMPQAVLQDFGRSAAAQAPTVEAHQAFLDHFFSSAVICPVDAAGRIVLSDDLCRFAGIKKQAVLAGGGSKFDLWSPEGWDAHRKATTANYETILKSIGL